MVGPILIELILVIANSLRVFMFIISFRLAVVIVEPLVALRGSASSGRKIQESFM